MNLTLTEKVLRSHLVSGELKTGGEISIRIDQTLTQDSTGTMAYLQLEAMDIPKVQTKLSVAYIDHNTLQCGFENGDDHRYIETVAAKYGIVFSKAGNGICHQVHLERFGRPGWTLLGSDSHTPTAGGIGMLAIGAGGLDVAVAMAGGAYHLAMPKICRVILKGKLPPWSSAKDIILELLRRLTVKGGVGRIFEYAGDGLCYLAVPERATICNMGAELGATTSLFPSDERTREFLTSQGRADCWVELVSDENAVYDEEIVIDLSLIEPLVAKPHSPDNVDSVRALAGLVLDQIAIGSCTNSSYADLLKAAKILEGKQIHPNISLVIAPGSRQVLTLLAKNGALTSLIQAGARILESACGPCIGMGQAPPSGGVSLRTSNRNFEGRSGTPDAKIYLASPEVAAASALTGVLTDPRTLGELPVIDTQFQVDANDNLLLFPPEDGTKVEVVRGPNIKPFPRAKSLPGSLNGEVLLKAGDNITTDHIMPSHAHLLPYRSNIPYLAEYCLSGIDPAFPERAKTKQGGFIVAGTNYGQGSSREHAALAPLYLGIKGVIAKSFARIHRANLINFGIVPMTFVNEVDYDELQQGDDLRIQDFLVQAQQGRVIHATFGVGGRDINFNLEITARELEILLAGGLLNYTKQQGRE